MQQKHDNTIELLFVAGSSRDRKGRRILIKDGPTVENYIFSEDELRDAALMKLLGVTDKQRNWMEKFLADSKA